MTVACYIWETLRKALTGKQADCPVTQDCLSSMGAFATYSKHSSSLITLKLLCKEKKQREEVKSQQPPLNMSLQRNNAKSLEGSRRKGRESKRISHKLQSSKWLWEASRDFLWWVYSCQSNLLRLSCCLLSQKEFPKSSAWSAFSSTQSPGGLRISYPRLQRTEHNSSDVHTKTFYFTNWLCVYYVWACTCLCLCVCVCPHACVHVPGCMCACVYFNLLISLIKSFSLTPSGPPCVSLLLSSPNDIICLWQHFYCLAVLMDAQGHTDGPLAGGKQHLPLEQSQMVLVYFPLFKK